MRAYVLASVIAFGAGNLGCSAIGAAAGGAIPRETPAKDLRSIPRGESVVVRRPGRPDVVGDFERVLPRSDPGRRHERCADGAAFSVDCGLVAEHTATEEYRQSFRAARCADMAADACDERLRRDVEAELQRRYSHADFVAVAKACSKQPELCSTPADSERLLLRSHNESVAALAARSLVVVKTYDVCPWNRRKWCGTENAVEVEAPGQIVTRRSHWLTGLVFGAALDVVLVIVVVNAASSFKMSGQGMGFSD